jgi:hypothetical protein
LASFFSAAAIVVLDVDALGSKVLLVAPSFIVRERDGVCISGLFIEALP